jgi:hypothetical protein
MLVLTLVQRKAYNQKPVFKAAVEGILEATAAVEVEVEVREKE